MATGIKTALRAHLLNTASISAHVGQHVYAMVAPLGVLRSANSWVTLSRQSSEHRRHMGGTAKNADHSIVIDCYSKEAQDLEAMTEEIRTELSALNGTLGSGSFTKDVNRVVLESQSDDYDMPEGESGRVVYHTSMEFTITAAED